MEETIRALNTADTLRELTRQLDTSKRVFFTRFGDGEILLATGRPTGDHDWSTELQAEMIEALNIYDPYFLKGLSVSYPVEEGMKPGLFAPFEYNDALDQRMKLVLRTGETEFYSPILFHYLMCFKSEEFLSFLDRYIRPKKKMYMGCRNRDDMKKIFGPIDYHVETPTTNTFYYLDKYWSAIEENAKKVDLVILGVGATAKVVQKRLWNLSIDIHSIDAGSICDIFVENSAHTWLKLKGRECRSLFEGTD